MINYFVLGLNHKTAPVEIREKISFQEQELKEALTKILIMSSVEEVMLLSTCNRVELIGACDCLDKIKTILMHFLSKVKGITIPELEKCLYLYTKRDAIRHVFRVASSLDSLIVGEPQILGQLKSAIRSAENASTVGKKLHYLTSEAIRVAKKVRTQTNIAEHAVSTSFAAVELAKKNFSDISKSDILIIGTGKMSILALRSIRKIASTGKLYIANRSYEKASETAEEFNGIVVPFEKFPELLGHVDIVISSTSAKEYIINIDDVRDIILERNGNPLFIIDIAVPRDFDTQIDSLPNVNLYNIDDLKEIVQKNVLFRKQEAKNAEKIINDEIEKFELNLQSAALKPLIISLQNWFEQVRSDELQQHNQQIEKMTKQDKLLVQHITQAIVKRILHNPLQTLRRNFVDSKPMLPYEAVEKLFGLQVDEKIDASQSGE